MTSSNSSRPDSAAAGHRFEARLIDMELRYMQMERLVDELSSVVADQAKTLDRLRADLTALAAHKLASSEGGDDGDHGDHAFERDRPPHY